MLLNTIIKELMISLSFLIKWIILPVVFNLNIVLLIIILVLYTFIALAFSTISRKLNYNKPWLAWIPIANLFLIPILADYKWWWGFIYLLSFIFVSFLMSTHLMIVILFFIFFIFITVMNIIWYVKIFKKRNYSPLLILLFLVPIVDIVLLCLLAWKDKN
jgi:hypothetical protein